jgi:chromosomal replication initiator protein
VVGTNNDFAYSASLSLASKTNLAQNSLFLLSATGNGKSHLAQAVGHHILAHYPLQNVCYVTAEDFINEMVHAFRHNSTEAFKEKYRTQSDVLILEDVHFLAGKERTQTELALALDYLFDADKKIIFTSCSLPNDIPKINDQLLSRFTSGLITQIEPPDFKTRLRILQQKIKENGCQVPSEVSDYLAAELSENVRQLESGLIGVMTKSSLLRNPVDLNLARSVVKHISRSHKQVTIDSIKELVCRHFNISVAEVVSNSRKQAIVRPRHIAIYLSRKYTDHSLQTIGKNFNKYHATIIHSINAVEKGLKTDASLGQQVAFFCHKLEAGE